VLLFDAATFLVAASLLALVPNLPAPVESERADEMLAGVRYIARKPFIRAIARLSASRTSKSRKHPVIGVAVVTTRHSDPTPCRNRSRRCDYPEWMLALILYDVGLDDAEPGTDQ
jgi:hypothetical protein